MLMIKKGGNKRNGLLRSWLDCLFPPLCRCCKEPCETTLLCPECWELAAFPDPLERCRHCFAPKVEEFCPICRNQARFSFPSAFVFELVPPVFALLDAGEEIPETAAAFALLQWENLDWPMPDLIVPLPKCRKMGAILASWMDRPFVNVLRRGVQGWSFDREALDEDQIILALSDGETAEELSEAMEGLAEAFPKKIFVLSLIPIKSNTNDEKQLRI